MSSASLILPTRGQDDPVSRALAAVGEISGLEVIVVCDGCDPQPSWADRFPFARFMRTKKTAGPAAVRNFGAREAAGKILLFMDDDILPCPGALRLLSHAANGSDSAWVGAIVPHPSVLWNAYVELAYSGVAHQAALPEKTPLRCFDFCSALAAIPREAFLRLGGFDERFRWYEDAEWACRFMESGGTIRFCREARGQHMKPMDRDWFIRRCETSGPCLRLLYELHPGLQSLSNPLPVPVQNALLRLGILWPAAKHLLPITESLPASLAIPLLKAINRIGLAHGFGEQRK